MNKKKNELKNLSAQELGGKVDELRRELFSLRLQAATSPVKDHTQYKKLRREIACALTYLRQKIELELIGK
jgi:large subunit ribosomal protein L29